MNVFEVKRDAALLAFHEAESVEWMAQIRVSFAEHEIDEAVKEEDVDRILAAEAEIMGAHAELAVATERKQNLGVAVEAAYDELYRSVRP